MKPIVQEELMLWPGRSLKNRPTLTTFLAAATSGLLSAVVTHPFDTIKTRMQANLDVPVYRYLLNRSTKLLVEFGLKVKHFVWFCGQILTELVPIGRF